MARRFRLGMSLRRSSRKFQIPQILPNIRFTNKSPQNAHKKLFENRQETSKKSKVFPGGIFDVLNFKRKKNIIKIKFI